MKKTYWDKFDFQMAMVYIYTVNVEYAKVLFILSCNMNTHTKNLKGDNCTLAIEVTSTLRFVSKHNIYLWDIACMLTLIFNVC